MNSFILPDTGETLHLRIKKCLLAYFQTISINDRIPSVRDLAARMNVSFLTVNKVVSELETEGYVTRYQGKGTFLASRDRRIVRESTASTAGEIIIAYPDVFSYSYWLHVHLAEELALKSGLRVVEFKISPQTNYEALVTLVREHPQALGILIDPPAGSITRDAFDLLDSLDIPVVLFASCDYPSLGQQVHTITGDEFQSGYLRVSTLIERGHRWIGYVGNEPSAPSLKHTYLGMKQAMRDNGLPLRNFLQPKIPRAKPWQNSMESGHRLTHALMDHKSPSAIIYDSFHGAFGGLRALHERAIRVPADVCLLTVGCHAGFEKYTIPTIAYVTTSTKDEMQMAFDIVSGKVSHPTKFVLMPYELVEGESLKSWEGETCRKAPTKIS